MEIKTRSYQFALKTINFIDTIPKDTVTKVIIQQLIRSATSVGANIVEGRASSSRKDFTNFLTHSLKSANETKYWLELLRDANKADKVTITLLLKEIDEIARILASSILTLKGKRKF